MKKRAGWICIICCISGIYILLCNIIINCLRPVTYQSISNKMIFETHSSTSSDNETLQSLQQSQVIYSLHPVFNEITITPPSSNDKSFQHLQQSQVSLDDEFLLTHPVFKEFNITLPFDKRFVYLLVIVTTGPQRYDRRKAIRDTWWSQCKNQKDVECIFITDRLDFSDVLFSKLMNEQLTYRDIHFQNINGGFLFGIRFIYHLVYAMLNYKFHYILRADDDYFLCFDKILYELPKSPIPMFHWGWVHQTSSVVRPDESLNMFSYDVIREYLFQDVNSFYCHPLGGQLIAIWTSILGINNLFRHDKRLFYNPKINASLMLTQRNFCKHYIGIHGAYPDYMLHFWKYRKSSDLLMEYKRDLKENSKLIPSKVFHWEKLKPYWRYEPKLCIEQRRWVSKNEEQQGQYFRGKAGQ